MTKKILMMILCVIFLLIGKNYVEATNKWELPHIGVMTLPDHVILEKGNPSTIALKPGKSVGDYFKKWVGKNGSYYLLTYANPPDFSYGWAASLELGTPFLLEIGEIAHKNDSAEERMNIIANYFNNRLKQEIITYNGEAPLRHIISAKDDYWMGSFTITNKEKNITYREAYQVILCHDHYFVYLGIINSDAEQKFLTSTIEQMVKKREIVPVIVNGLKAVREISKNSGNLIIRN